MTRGMVPRIVMWVAMVGLLVCCDFPNDMASDRTACGAGQPHIGMTKAEALNTIWCAPNHINTSETANHIDEQWVYRDPTGGVVDRYLHFEDGVLIAIHR
jgi:hypothetical protein